MQKNNFDTTGDSFAVKSDTILANEDKLRIVLFSVYETARKKSLEFRFSSCYKVLFSVSLTLLVTLFTSTFNPIGCVSAETVTLCAWVLFVLSLVLGIIFLVVFFNGKSTDWVDHRDETVKTSLDGLKK